ncbi:MAG: efflux RND transporter permease subunit [Planctomycetes bacterium]|nr:efflux RND transporter permease subunit [Planctomycetota bacterium]
MSAPLEEQTDAPSGWLAGVVARPVAITMCAVALAVFGAVSFTKLRIDLLPEISYPTLTVRTTYPGAAPEDIEDRVSERVQEALSTLPHLVRTTSVSRAETSDVILDFDWGTPMTFAVQDVRDKLDGVFLPSGAEKPLILRYDPNLDPILRIGISAPRSDAPKTADDRIRELMHLRWLAEKRIKRELETIKGVAAVQVRGGLQEEIRVRVDPFKMAAQSLDPDALAVRLAQENLNASGGLIREGSTDYLVRTQNEFRDLSEIADLAVVRRNDAVIRVRDIATVERTYAKREVITRLDGGEAVEIAVFREAGANIVELADRVQERVFGPREQRGRPEPEKQAQGQDGGDEFISGHLARQYKKDARFEVLSDQSTFIRDSIEDVKSSGWLGISLTILVIGFSLRRLIPTLVISVSIPISVIVTFAPMYLGNVSLNIMSLGGLALGIGMVVDASIVVLESIARCREEGDGPVQAAVRGTREVMGSIIGATLTSIAVFAPIVFVHGIAGRIFGDQALTVVCSLSASLLVAAFFIPMLAGRSWFNPEVLQARVAGQSSHLDQPLEWQRGSFFSSLLRLLGRMIEFVLGWAVRLCALLFGLVAAVIRFLLKPLAWLHDRAWSAVEGAYPRVLGLALKHAVVVVLVAAVLLGLAIRRAGTLGLDLLPEIHQGEFTAHVGLDVGTPIETTDFVMSEIERDVRALPEVALTALVVGVERDMLTRDLEGKHTSRLTVRLQPGLANVADEERVLALVRDRIAAQASVRTLDFTRPTPFALDAPIQVEVLGYDLEQIRAVGTRVTQTLSALEGLSDVRSSVRTGHPEARLRFDREKTLEYGLDLEAVSKLVRDSVLGNVSTRFNRGDDRIDVRILGDEILLGRLDRVLDLVVNPASERPVRLRDIATVEHVQGPAEIRRIGNTRAVVVTAATTGFDLGTTADRVQRAIAQIETPDDVIVQVGGQKREMNEASDSLRFALLLAVFLVYAVMASQFESLLQPLIIIGTIPMAMIGVIFALGWLSISLSVVVFIGAILLAGIVVNNAIVLIGRVNQMRAKGLTVHDALVDAARTRLRPIYMTTATTVLGLLPLTGWLDRLPFISATGAGAELRAPMAITVVTGLTCATVLTLIVIPSIYALIYRRRDPNARPA